MASTILPEVGKSFNMTMPWVIIKQTIPKLPKIIVFLIEEKIMLKIYMEYEKIKMVHLEWLVGGRNCVWERKRHRVVGTLELRFFRAKDETLGFSYHVL